MKSLLITAFTAALLATTMADRKIDDPIADSLAHPDRSAADKERDLDRFPQRVLDLFGIKRGMHVADIMAGDGYYTEILSRAVGKEGKVYCQNTKIPLDVFARKPLTARLKRPGLENVVRLDREFESDPFPKDLDAATLIRFYHDFGWQKVDRVAFNKMVFEMLKPGGIFGVVDHVALPGKGISEGKSLHRVEPALVRKEIEAAGFVFEAESHALHNPDDTHDWNIFSGARNSRDKTDRFIYLFRKPLE